jgi:hypothetical protein
MWRSKGVQRQLLLSREKVYTLERFRTRWKPEITVLLLAGGVEN